jgi:cell division protein FtsB
MKLPRLQLTGSSIVNVVGLVIVVYLLVMLGETIHRNYTLGRQINTLKAQIALLQDQKDELAYNIEYYKTDSFRDREARSKLGLQLPGENVVIIPHTTPEPSVAPEASKKASGKRSNLQQWLDFLGGRG